MFHPRSKVIRLSIQVGVLLLGYTLGRMVFLLANSTHFSSALDWSVLVQLFTQGLVFDLSAIFLTNILFVFLSLLPTPATGKAAYQKVLGLLFILPNSLFLLSNFVDAAYFPFTGKRMQADVLLFVTGAKGSDFFLLLPTFILEYWYLWAAYLGLVWLMWKLYRFSLGFDAQVTPDKKSYSWASIVFVLGMATALVAARGGLQVRPLDFIHAAEWTDVQNIPILLNSPFSIIKSADKKRLTDPRYFEENQLNACEKGLHYPDSTLTPAKQNVVILIVESLSREYMSCFNGMAKTPFLDSIFSQGMVFSNGFANAKESIQGIPAILAAIPSLQNDPFIFSPYSGNKISSFANLLKPLGYHSVFYHGGKKGTMGFDAFAALAGFDTYVGMEQYPDIQDYDGHWGIWDEPFLRFTAEQMNQLPQPFVTAVFTINTHHPFKTPAQYGNRFKTAGHPILSCVQYADFALEQFFKKAAAMPWFDNTIFVITADHIGPKIGSSSFTQDYSIPICFYKADGSLKGKIQQVANQIDILPSVLHLLHYPKPYFSMGKNLFSTDCPSMVYEYNAGVYSCFDSAYCYQFNGQTGKGLYRWKNDPYFQVNYLSREQNLKKNYEDKIKKFIQLFNGSMVYDKMFYASPQ